MEGIQLRISDLIYAVWKRRRLILLLTCLGIVTGVLMTGMSKFQNNVTRTRIQASVAINTQTESGFYFGYSKNPSQQDLKSAVDLANPTIYIMKSDTTVENALNGAGILSVTPATVKRNLSVKQYQTTPILEIELSWHEEEEAISLLNSLIRETEKGMQSAFGLGKLAMVIPPRSAGIVYVVSKKNNNAILLAICGMFAGIAFAVLEILVRPTLINIRDVEDVLNLEHISTITADKEYYDSKQPILEKASNLSATTQNFAALAHIIRNRLGTVQNHHCISVTSTAGGEGKTEIAVNLAIQLSRMEQKVLLIDLNTVRPGIGNMFSDNIDYSRTLNYMYTENVSPEDAVMSITGYLDILPCFIQTPPIELDTILFEKIRRLSEQYDYTIIDAPPVGEVAGTLSLSEVASQALFVVKYDSAPLPDIQDAVDKMAKSGVRIIGCVVNQITKNKIAKKNGIQVKRKQTQKEVWGSDKIIPPKSKRPERKMPLQRMGPSRANISIPETQPKPETGPGRSRRRKPK